MFDAVPRVMGNLAVEFKFGCALPVPTIIEQLSAAVLARVRPPATRTLSAP